MPNDPRLPPAPEGRIGFEGKSAVAGAADRQHVGWTEHSE